MSKYTCVMIVDDSETDNFLNKIILVSNNWCDKVTTYTNPLTALNFLKQTLETQNEKPEIIFLDINMPLMSGFQFLDEFIKLPNEITQGIKFYMLSSSDDPSDLEKINEYGNLIIKFLKKPLDKNQLLNH